jgi:hypothetical protein
VLFERRRVQSLFAGFCGGLDGVALHVLDRLVHGVAEKSMPVDAEMRHAGFGAGVAQVLGVLAPGQSSVAPTITLSP